MTHETQSALEAIISRRSPSAETIACSIALVLGEIEQIGAAVVRRIDAPGRQADDKAVTAILSDLGDEPVKATPRPRCLHTEDAHGSDEDATLFI